MSDMKRKQTKLLTTGSAKWPKQLTKPCSDCPFRRDSLRGWLGGETPENFRLCAHSDAPILCHVDQEWHCDPDQFVKHHTT